MILAKGPVSAVLRDPEGAGLRSGQAEICLRREKSTGVMIRSYRKGFDQRRVRTMRLCAKT